MSNEVTIENVWTRGKLYAMSLSVETAGMFPGTHIIREYKHGHLQGFASLGRFTREQAVEEFQKRISQSALYDGISYTGSSLYSSKGGR